MSGKDTCQEEEQTEKLFIPGPCSEKWSHEKGIRNKEMEESQIN